MAKKLGTVGIVTLIIVFIVSSFSLFLSEADSNLNVSSGTVQNSFNNFTNTLQDGSTGSEAVTNDFISSLTDEADLSANPNSDVDDRASDSGGSMSFSNQNLLTNFFRSIKIAIPESERIINFIIGLMALTITILFTRMLIGDGKI